MTDSRAKSQPLFLTIEEKSATLLINYGFDALPLPEHHDFEKLFTGKNIYLFNENPFILDALVEFLSPVVSSLKIISLHNGHKTIAELITDSEKKKLSENKIRLMIADLIEGTGQEITTGGELEQRARKVLCRQEARCFDTSKIPELLRNYINHLCETTNSDPVIITSSVYAMLSGVIGKRVFIGNYFQRLYPNLWMLAVSASGTFKTTGLNKGAKIAYNFEDEIRQEIEKIQAEVSQLEGSKKETEKAEKNLLSQIAKLEAMSPVLPNRSTAEGLIDALSHGQAGTIFLSEFGDWLRTMEQSYNAGLKSLFVDLYDCPQQRNFRTRTGGTIRVQYPFISICGVSTLSWVQKNVKLDDVGSGFFARFLLFYPPQKDEFPPALPTISLNKNSGFEAEIQSFLAMLEETEFQLSPDSVVCFNKIHREIYERVSIHGEKTKEILTPYLKRWSPYILKLAMINQLFINPESKISVEAIRGAYSIVDYAIDSTTYLFQNDLGESDHQRKCRLVLEYIAKRGGVVTRHDLMGSKTLEGGSKDYDYALESLIESGKITVDTSPKLKNSWKYLLNGEVE